MRASHKSVGLRFTCLLMVALASVLVAPVAALGHPAASLTQA